MATSEHKFPRCSGILLHPSSLPGPYGIGDLGPAAYRWIDALADARQKVWQILPLGHTNAGGSPYQCYSAFAGNPLLISPEFLERDGLLSWDEIGRYDGPADRVDYARVSEYKLGLLERAYGRFCHGAGGHLKGDFDRFCGENHGWLEDYAAFLALKESRNGEAWFHWPRELLVGRGDRRVIEAAHREMPGRVGLHQFTQFLFARQWRGVRDHARYRGITLVGDIPIFVAADSADVWANGHLFLLDENSQLKALAGVPPDYFSPTGQLWGNPLYDWPAMAADGFAWWVERLRVTFEAVDLVRLDHFRGFCAAWQVPAGSATAESGAWVPGPGGALLERFRAEFPNLPIIAEDLGDISPDVYELRDRFNLPGMKVLQFAFNEPKNAFLPHNFSNSHCVVYTGTHDNDTNVGWFHTLDHDGRRFLAHYLGHEPHDISWDLIRLAWASAADLAVVPLQDVFSLGGDARMNTPGKPDDNWQWRVGDWAFHDERLHLLKECTELYNRIP